MDTKWKNMVKAIKKFIKEYYDCVFGFLLFIIGSFLFFVVLVNRYYFSTWGVWRICLIGNILVQPGICLLVRRYMKLRYRNWSQKGSAETYLQDTEDSIYYQTWKAKEKQSEKRFRNILAVELSAAAAYLFFISYSSRWGWNYAAGYMMVATVFIEYICCREVLQRYWRNELDQIMEQTESFFQKRLEQALEIERKSLEKVSRSDQLRVDLITNVSHDLKTPLTSIVAYLTMLEDHPDMPEEERKAYTHIALEKSIRLGELINEFFDITRYNLQNIELEPVEIDLTMMLEQLADELYGVLQEKKLTCEVDVEEDLMIYGDPDKLARVFDNILRNAIAYCYADTEIRIEAKMKDGDIEITFTNAGDKIPGDMLQTIFEKFYRVDGSRSTGTGGAGLGLAIAKQIVELHGGRILAKSDDNRTQFVVTLPSKEKTEQKEGSEDEVHTHRRLAFRGKTGRGKRLQSK